ncbi:Major Facilitator Superfamily protein [Corynebacterium capitovis DSM 44611]|uniref:MFS transporter n=1 Tax=Corynebacterium capitovis TaxID=131081 RepID=UPI0003723980|nr:MFS transporter [Corynebacterium capitovis]WKD57971.1 Major Facilitator Superfamily protein [Corynebacterium capitovis DSM 44611]
MDTTGSDALESRNARRFIWANGLQGVGDQVVAGKTVLPWVFTAAGVPAVFTAFLVPIREAGSMLPQAALTPWVASAKSRTRLWIIGSLGQALAAAAIAVAALLLDGIALGSAVVLFLAIQAVFRALCSIAGKDVQGRTISKGRRGEVTGRATALTGAATLVIGFGLSAVPDSAPRWVVAALLGGGAATWAFAAIVFAGVREPVAKGRPSSTDGHNWLAETLALLREDRKVRSFLLVRSLMLVTALSTPFIVVLAHESGQDLTGLGAFVVASGGASLLGGRVSGWWSDVSSKQAMAWSAGAASVVLVILVASARWASSSVNAWVMPLGFFLVNLAHTTVRVSRKTYLVDMAEGDRRTLITGASNTVMGVVLLVVGGLSSLVSTIGTQETLVFLAALGAAGVVGAGRLEDVSGGRG